VSQITETQGIATIAGRHRRRRDPAGVALADVEVTSGPTEIRTSSGSARSRSTSARRRMPLEQPLEMLQAR
jgi:hypothetical protein